MGWAVYDPNLFRLDPNPLTSCHVPCPCPCFLAPEYGYGRPCLWGNWGFAAHDWKTYIKKKDNPMHVTLPLWGLGGLDVLAPAVKEVVSTFWAFTSKLQLRNLALNWKTHNTKRKLWRLKLVSNEWIGKFYCSADN